MEEDVVTRLPFAMIDDIADGSPAALDGLLLGDEIVKFGSVEAGGRLQERLVSEALSSEDNQVSLLIIRQGSPMNVTITPRKWHGRGLMGYVLLKPLCQLFYFAFSLSRSIGSSFFQYFVNVNM